VRSQLPKACDVSEECDHRGEAPDVGHGSDYRRNAQVPHDSWQTVFEPGGLGSPFVFRFF